MDDPRFEACLKFTDIEEGGWADDPQDPGGATQRGITLALFTTWRKNHDRPAPTKEDLRDISDDERAAILAVEFWNRVRGHDLPIGLDLMCFDFAVNANPHRAALLLQQALRMPEAGIDGWIGVKTIKAAQQADMRSVISETAMRQQEFYFSSPNYPRFGHDWLARTNRRLLAAWDMSRAATPQPIALPAPVAAA